MLRVCNRVFRVMEELAPDALEAAFGGITLGPGAELFRILLSA